MELAKIELTQFGKIEECLSTDCKTEYWRVKFGDDKTKGPDSAVIIAVNYPKDKYPNKEDIPLNRKVAMKWDDLEENDNSKVNK